MIEKDFDWRHTDKNGHTHEWNPCGRSVGVFLDDEESFEVLYQMFCNSLLVKCRQCNDTFLAQIKGDGSNGV